MLLLAATRNVAAQTAVTTQPYDNKGPAHRLTNGTVELVIVPSIGRAMRYGYVGGANVLFEHPHARDQVSSGTFINFGGDKAWPWPQGDWMKRIGRSFPPPEAADGRPWDVRVLSDRAVRMTSDPIEPWGLRIVRDVSLAPAGTEVIWHNRIEKIDERTTTPPTAVWSVTQVPATAALSARLIADAPKEFYRLMMTEPWGEITRDGDTVAVRRNPASTSKMGLEARQLCATFADGQLGPNTPAVRFTQTLDAGAGAVYAPCERAQLFSLIDAKPGDVAATPYIELEWTSPKSDFQDGKRSAEMTVRWELSTPAIKNP